ncbi:hypothetical protein PC123_g19629 [Phytophthora cactorum]|nr:hypothetical protein PC123_g19629 [Phytophthora cactorum]
MRVFNKDTPHKLGTKVFVVACAKTAYCMRLEIYCDAKTHLRTPVPQDNNSGEAAVLRNMNALLPPTSISPWRLVVTDRFYTSVKLALELLHRRMYLTGTIQTDRSGFAKEIITTKKYKTVNRKKVLIPPQGTIKLAQNKKFPQVTAAMWMDRNPVHMLTSGGSRKEGTVMRRVNGEMKPVPAPELVRHYHRWMGGVDVNDQLRMQRYSVQLSYKTRKYYKTLFLRLLDVTFVNAYIVYRHHRKTNVKSPPKHFAFFEELMEQLLAVDSVEAFAEIEEATCARERTAPSPARARASRQAGNRGDDVVVDERHRLEESPDTIEGEQGVKKRQQSCKVCALHKVKPRKFTKYFCPECSSGNKRKYLCNVGRDGRDTCFRVWHLEWNNGNGITRELLQSYKTRDRPPSARPGKKQRRRPRESGDQPTAGSDGGEGGDVDADDDDEDLAGDQP